MAQDRFEALAHELAERDRELPAQLAAAAPHAERLHLHALTCVETFRRAARERGADHLVEIRIGPVEPDDKHVDCLQFRIERGRWVAVCVAKANGTVTLVGPFKQGKPEEPCRDHALASEAAREGLEDLLLALLRSASER